MGNLSRRANVGHAVDGVSAYLRINHTSLGRNSLGQGIQIPHIHHFAADAKFRQQVVHDLVRFTVDVAVADYFISLIQQRDHGGSDGSHAG